LAFDGFLARADRQPDPGLRARELAAAEATMLQDVAVAPVFFYVNKSLVSPNVTGWVDNLIHHHRSKYLCLRGRSPAAAPATVVQK
jgi:oligopeptide transport system substrate-binding protein